MNKQASLLVGTGLGAGIGYFLSPGQSRRRRARVRDRIDHYSHALPGAVSVTGRDLAHRTRGTLAEVLSFFRRERDLTDDVIEDRVRSSMGRVVSHPHSIEVASDDGNVTLRGIIRRHELKPLLDCISRVKGVRSVVNQLEVHKRIEHVSDLQGGTPRSGHRMDVLQNNWAPATRLLMGAAGSMLASLAFRRRDPLSIALSSVGGLVLLRSITNIETRRLLGVGGGRRVIEFQKSVEINASIENVYRFWAHFANFPRFMTEVSEVRISNERQSHWTVKGPLGSPIRFDAEVTANVPNKILAWRTVPGSLVQHAGQVKFMPGEKGGTKVEIRFSYNPPGGVLGHELARLFGSDPKRRIEESLGQMKQLIEQGPSLRQMRA